MLAETKANTLKTVFEEIFDRLETTAMELSEGKPLEFSSNWKHASDMTAQLWLKYATGENHKQYIGTEYPATEEAFGKKVIFVIMSAAIVSTEKFNYISFVSFTKSSTQSETDKYHYYNGELFETIY